MTSSFLMFESWQLQRECRCSKNAWNAWGTLAFHLEKGMKKRTSSLIPGVLPVSSIYVNAVDNISMEGVLWEMGTTT
jgi:hypothetical protein